MQFTEEQAVGDIGETDTDSNFQRIGWAKCVKLLQDVGTDLLTFARDENRNELSLPVGLQVESSEKEFLTPADNLNGAGGWWHYERDHRHMDFWIRHGFPHLLVLTDVANRVSYWQHVTGSIVVPTDGIGYKIFVPHANVVNVANARRLIDVAVAGSKRSYTLPGSVWNGRDDIAVTARWRHALVAPRLIAPHPNRMLEELQPDHALALYAEMRFGELERYSPLPGSQMTGSGSRTFGWRLVEAFRQLLASGSSDNLQRLLNSGLRRRSYDEAAARICSRRI
jgi:hypothetical protein